FSTDQNPEYTYTESGTYDVTLTAQNDFGSDDTLMTAAITVDLSQQLVPTCEPPTVSFCCGYGILEFDFEGISVPSENGIEGYQDFSCGNVAEVTEGESYPISIELGADNPNDTHVFIDFNNDGDFNLGELVFSGLNTSSVSGTLEIPAEVPVVETRVRLRVLSDFVGNGNSGCFDIQLGQVEDYSIIIFPDTTPPTANFVPNVTLSCDGEVSFTNLSTSATDYFWYFGDSNTSEDENPTHVYSSEGSFTVSLVATNDYGVDSIAFEDLILVDFDAVCDTINMPENGIGDVLTDCNGYLADDGGPNEPYSNNTSGSQTIEVPPGNFVQLEFSEFFFQFNNDFLFIYDGPNETAPLIGQYTGNALPNGGVITSTGNSITLKQISNFFGQFSGFVLEWSCLPVGIEELERDILSIYPNPADDHFYINTDIDLAIISVSIFDNIGRLIARSSPDQITVDVSYLPAGNYFIEILTEKGISKEKLIKR
ncbi:MAG: PKD domain-containing protein, partial [Flavobacteriales bacterium]|nr:PKD domain-containing protein [Flavobacteriales bacterium]